VPPPPDGTDRDHDGCRHRLDDAGLLLLKGDFVPGFSQLDSQGQILAYAIVFGVAQHLVTRFVDQRAGDMLSSLPRKERSPARAEQTSQATQSAGRENPASTMAA